MNINRRLSDWQCTAHALPQRKMKRVSFSSYIARQCDILDVKLLDLRFILSRTVVTAAFASLCYIYFVMIT